MTSAAGSPDAPHPALLSPEGMEALEALIRGGADREAARRALGALAALRSAATNLQIAVAASLTAGASLRAGRSFDAFDRTVADLHERVFGLADEARELSERSRREARRPSLRDRRRFARLFLTPAGSVRTFLPLGALEREDDRDLLARLARRGLVDEVADGWHLRQPGRDEVHAASSRLVRIARRAAALLRPHLPAFALGILTGLLANLLSRWIGLT